MNESVVDEIVRAYRRARNSLDASTPEAITNLRNSFAAQHSEYAEHLHDYFACEDRAEDLLWPYADLDRWPENEREEILTRLYAEHPELEAFIDEWWDGIENADGLLGSREAPQHPWIGQTVGGFHLEQVIGQGGMGLVFRGVKDTGADAELAVAVKSVRVDVLITSSEAIKAFQREISSLLTLEHPHIVPIRDADVFQGVPYLVMPLVTGGTLKGRMGEFHGNYDEIADLIRQMALTVQFAHDHAVLHRDLKPSNILFDEHGRCLIADFGLAKVIGGFGNEVLENGVVTKQESLFSQGRIGTRGYSAPEICPPAESAVSKVPATVTADVYSLGALLYALITGETPPEVVEVGGVSQDGVPRYRDVPSCRCKDPKVPARLEAIVSQCMKPEPGERYLRAIDVAVDLENFVKLRPVNAANEGVLARLCLCFKRNVASSVLALLFFAALVAFGSYYLLSEYAAARALQEGMVERLATSGILLSQRPTPWLDALQVAAAAVEGERLAPEISDSDCNLAFNMLRDAPQPVGYCDVRQNVDDGWTLEKIGLDPTGSYLSVCLRKDQVEKWRVFDWRTRRELFSNEENVTSLCAWGPNPGQCVIGTLANPSFRIVDATDSSGGLRIECNSPIRRAAFDSSGKYVMTIGERVAIWRTDSGAGIDVGDERVNSAFDCLADPHHPGRFFVRTWSGGACVVVDVDSRNDLATSIQAYFQYADGQHNFFFAADDTICSLNDRRLDVFDLRSGELLNPRDDDLPPFWLEGTPFTPVVSLGGRHVVLSRYTQLVCVDVSREAVRITGQTQLEHDIHAVAFTDDGDTFVTCGDDHAMRTFSFLTTRSSIQPIPTHPAAHSVSSNPHSGIFAIGQIDGLIKIWKTPANEWRQKTALRGEIGRVEFSNDGSHILTCGLAHRGVQPAPATVIASESGQPTGQPFAAPGIVLDATFGTSPDEILVCTSTFTEGTERGKREHDSDACSGQLSCWNFQSGVKSFDDILMPHEPRSVAVRPGQTQFAILDGTGEVALFDGRSGVRVATLDAGRNWYTMHHFCSSGRLQFSPDGACVAVFGRQEPARIIEVSTGRLLGELPHQNEVVHGLAFSSDGKRIATAGLDKVVRVWRVDNVTEPEFVLPHSEWVYSADFHSDCRYLVTGCRDGDARIYDLDTGTLITELHNGDINEVFDAKFLNQDRWIAVATRWGVCRIWDWETKRPITREFSADSGNMDLYCAIAPDGRHAAWSGFSNIVTVLHMDDLSTPSEFTARRGLLTAELISGQQLTAAGSAKLTSGEWISRLEELLDQR
ncbi:protein kinase [bacterium]|nr:protein kinase [bacterium]